MYPVVNSIAHKFNMYPILNTILYFINKSFIKKTKYPIISIILFIIVIVLNSIQYHTNDKKYLQNKIKLPDITNPKTKNKYPANTINKSNTLLYIYEFIGINGFIDNIALHIVFCMLTYFCLSLIEMNIGYISVLFLLFIGVMFTIFWNQFQDAICTNNISSSSLSNSSYCCGSFVLFMVLGFVLYIIQNNTHNIYLRLLAILIIIITFFIISLYDYYVKYANDPDSPEKTCKSYTLHAANFMFGVVCALVLSN
jgi:hypothetical protein